MNGNPIKRRAAKVAHPILKQIGTVFIPVKDLQRSAEFYSRVFDLPLRKVSPPVYNLVLDGTPITLDVSNFEQPYREGEVQPSPNGMFYVPCTDIEQAHNFLIQLGAEVTPVERFHNVSLFFFFDPDRNKIMVYHNS
jgi:catechol 2,3-dioxygenase-like lactoylglutathione lyase family enzyme